MIYNWLCVFIKRGSWMGGGLFSSVIYLKFYFGTVTNMIVKFDLKSKMFIHDAPITDSLVSKKKIAPVSCNTKNWGLLHLYIHFSIYFSSLSIPAKYPAMLLFILIFKNMLWKQLKNILVTVYTKMNKNMVRHTKQWLISKCKELMSALALDIV